MKNINLKNTLTALIFMLLFFCSCTQAQSNKKLDVGDHVPVFTLYDQDGKSFNVNDYIGKKVLVIYFIPRMKAWFAPRRPALFVIVLISSPGPEQWLLV